MCCHALSDIENTHTHIYIFIYIYRSTQICVYMYVCIYIYKRPCNNSSCADDSVVRPLLMWQPDGGATSIRGEVEEVQYRIINTYITEQFPSTPMHLHNALCIICMYIVTVYIYIHSIYIYIYTYIFKELQCMYSHIMCYALYMHIMCYALLLFIYKLSQYTYIHIYIHIYIYVCEELFNTSANF